MRRAPAVELTDDERRTLVRYARGRSTPARLVLRTKIVLQAADGRENREIAAALGTSRKTVGLWRTRFARQRLPGSEQDAPRPGRTPALSAEVTQQILDKTTEQTPPNAWHWSTRSLAKELGISKDSVRRVWQAAGLQPHLSKTFKVSNDPQLAEKVVDIVGLYLDSPDKALVLSCDEKSSIQVLDCTQKSLPLFPGRLKTLTHDYKRNGTTTLFAAISVADGLVISQCQPRHRHQEWLKFLKQIDAETPPDLDLHLIVDNYATHKHPKVLAWLAKHPRFHLHFTPTSSSWLNLIERWSRNLTDRRLRRGVFRSVAELEQAIQEYVDHHNQDPRSFRWNKPADQILAKIARAKKALDKTPSV